MSGIGTKIIVTTTRKGIPGSEVAALVAETGWEYVPRAELSIETLARNNVAEGVVVWEARSPLRSPLSYLFPILYEKDTKVVTFLAPRYKSSDLYPADIRDNDGTTSKDMKTTYLWGVVNLLAPRLIDCSTSARFGQRSAVADRHLPKHRRLRRSLRRVTTLPI
jgi:hypothetical protein